MSLFYLMNNDFCYEEIAIEDGTTYSYSASSRYDICLFIEHRCICSIIKVAPCQFDSKSGFIG
jgi:hypothetical protein